MTSRPPDGGVAATLGARRQADDPRLNLKSNELLHPAAELLAAEIARSITGEAIRVYPAAGKVISLLAAKIGCEANEMLLSPGSDQAIRQICMGFAAGARGGPAGPLLLQHPNYLSWTVMAEALGIELVRATAPGTDPAEQSRTLAQMAAARRGGLIAVSTPNGPVGGVMAPADLDRLAEIAAARNHLLVIDACYQAFDGPWTAHLARPRPNTIIVQSFSKSHGLAGARVAVMRGRSDQLAALGLTHLEHAVSGPALAALSMALEREGEFAAIWADIAANRAYLARALVGLGCGVLPSGGNFLTFAPPAGRPAEEVWEEVSRRGYRTAILGVETGLDGYLRVTIADRARMDAFLSELARALAAAVEPALHGARE